MEILRYIGAAAAAGGVAALGSAVGFGDNALVVCAIIAFMAVLGVFHEPMQ